MLLPRVLDLCLQESDTIVPLPSAIAPELELKIGDRVYDLVFVTYWTGGHYVGQGLWGLWPNARKNNRRWFKYDDMAGNHTGQVKWAKDFDADWLKQYTFMFTYVLRWNQLDDVSQPVDLSEEKKEYWRVGSGEVALAQATMLKEGRVKTRSTYKQAFKKPGSEPEIDLTSE